MSTGQNEPERARQSKGNTTRNLVIAFAIVEAIGIGLALWLGR